MSVIVVIKVCRGRAVTNVGRTCGPTPLPRNDAIKYVYTIPAWFCVPNEHSFRSEQMHILKGFFALG